VIFYFVASAGGQVLYPEEMVAQQEAEASVVRGDTSHETLPEIDEGELKQVEAGRAVVIVDVRSRDAYGRGHRDGSINLPFPELTFRSRIELQRGMSVVVDCSFSQQWCNEAAEILSQEGFRDVLKLTEGGRQ
jgi:rhodanese-related sulfurtransferase